MLSKFSAGVRLAGVLTVALLAARPALAWEATGHRLIGELGMQSLPADLPAFLKDPATVWQMGELSREPDRSRGAGQPHDSDLDPGHFMDVLDDGHGLAGVVLTEMPRDRDAYSVVLHAAGFDLRKGGWLYYNLVDGYEQLVKDFAYYRADQIGLQRSSDPRQKAWYKLDIKLREQIVIRDLGYWSHFVGDASQPLHASVHFNGWGDYPNPRGYTQDHIHSPFEGALVNADVTLESARAAMPAPAPCEGPIGPCMGRYLQDTQAKVEPLYDLWSKGGLQPGDPRGKAFMNERIGVGAAKLRDLVVRAWHDSTEATVGYPGLKVSALQAGAPLPFEQMYGDPDGLLP